MEAQPGTHKTIVEHRGPDIKEKREGRIQSAERAVPTHPNILKATNLLSA
jgi:hypothetical protein